MTEVLRLIKEVEPPKPSTRLSELGRSGEPSRTSSSKGQDPARLAGPTSSLASVAAQRSIEPKLLRKSLSGDLDWIVMKALEKERSRRYETANGFAADINRYRAGEAVLAHPPSQAYRMQKFLRKNKGPVLATSLVFLALLAGIVGTAIGLYRADAQRVIAEAKQMEAEAQRAKAIAAAQSETEQRKRAEQAETETLNDYRASTDDAIEQLIGSKDDLGPSERTYLKNTLERWKRFADRVGDDQRGRAIRGEAHHRVGVLWNSLGQKDDALAENQAARQIRTELAEEFPAVPDYQLDLANTHNNLGLLFVSLSKPKEGRSEHSAAIEIGRKLVDQFPKVPEYQQALARAHDGLGDALDVLGQSVDSQVEKQLVRELLEKLIEQWPNIPEYQRALARNRYERGMFLDRFGKPDEAEQELEAALDVSKLLVEKFPAEPNYQQGLSAAYGGLSGIHLRLGKLGKALSESRAALEIKKELVKQFPAMPLYRSNLGIAHEVVARSLGMLGRSDDAISEYYSARDICEKLMEQFPDVPEYKARLARTYGFLGTHCDSFGKLDQARTAMEAGLNTQKNLAEQFPDVIAYSDSLGRSQGNYAETLKNQGQLDESLIWFNKSLQTLDAIYHQGVPGNTDGLKPMEAFHEGRAQTYQLLKKYSEAIKDFDYAVEYSSGQWQLNFRASRARSYALNDQISEAIAEVDELINSGAFDANGWYNIACVYSMASKKMADKQQEHADRAIKILNTAVSVGFNDTWHLGQDFELDPLREKDDFKKLLAELNSKYPPIDPVKNSGAVQFSVNWVKVFPYYLEALQRHREIQGPDHPDTINAIHELADAQTKLKEFVAAQRKEFPADDPGFGNLLAQASLGLLQAEQYATAEEMLRECLAIREKTQPDEWRNFNTKSMLGDSLRGQTKYDEAEPLLLAGYDGMKQRESTMTPQEKFRIAEALERLVALYTATGKSDQAAEWKRKLADYKALLNPEAPTEIAANSEPKPKEAAKSKTGAPAVAVSDLIVQATQAGRAREWGKAEKLLEGALANSPDHRQILLGLVETYQQHGMQLVNSGAADYSYFIKSAEYLRKLFKIQPELKLPSDSRQRDFVSTVLYNEACGLARGGESEKAIASLRESLDAGWEDLKLFDTDPDLDSLRDLPVFKELKELAHKGAEKK